MEARNVQKKEITLADKVRNLEKKASIKEKAELTKKKTKEFRFPFKWKMKFNQAKQKSKNEMMLVFFLNKKNQLESPKFMPIFDGNMIVWKNTPYEFDPRAVWIVKGMKGNPQAYIIKEIDRRPVMNHKRVIGKKVYKDAGVTNTDLDEVRSRGDSTESDAFLVKAVLSARLAKTTKAISKGVLIVLGIIVVGVIIWAVSRAGGGAGAG